jgi:hypothetical protein
MGFIPILNLWQVILLVDTILISYLITLGQGLREVDVNPDNLVQINLLNTVCAILSRLSACWSKTSFALTLTRITKGKLRIFIVVTAVIMNIALIGTSIMQLASCTPIERVWDKSVPGTCMNPKLGLDINLFAGGRWLFDLTRLS